jgi:hypothetical protein
MRKLFTATSVVIVLAAAGAPVAAAEHTVIRPIHSSTGAAPAEPLVVIVMENKAYSAIVGKATRGTRPTSNR